MHYSIEGVFASQATGPFKTLADSGFVVTDSPVAALDVAKVTSDTGTSCAVQFVIPCDWVVARWATSQRAVPSEILGLLAFARTKPNLPGGVTKTHFFVGNIPGSFLR